MSHTIALKLVRDNEDVNDCEFEGLRDDINEKLLKGLQTTDRPDMFQEYRSGTEFLRVKM